MSIACASVIGVTSVQIVFFSVISYWIILLAAKLESKNTDERSDEKLSRCRFREAYSAICAALSKYMTHTTLGGYKAKTRIF